VLIFPQKLALNSPTSGGCSVGIVRSQTKATEFVVCFVYMYTHWNCYVILDFSTKASKYYSTAQLYILQGSNIRSHCRKAIRLHAYVRVSIHRFNFVSVSNKAILRFHSDYSVAGTGFSATWQAVDISGCPSQTLTAREGTLMSPNYPRFLMDHLDCTTTILAPGALCLHGLHWVVSSCWNWSTHWSALNLHYHT
jgi:hypothetical protein